MQRVKDYGFQVSELVTSIPEGAGKALDVGCAEGGLGTYLKQSRGFDFVAGIEHNKKAAAKAAEHLDYVAAGDVEKLILPEKFKQFFDVIIYGDILEHLYNPAHVLKTHKQYLKHDGVIVVSIPNVKNLYLVLNLINGRFDYTEYGLMDESHIRFFTLETAIELFLKEGFEIRRLKRSIRDGQWHKKMSEGCPVNEALINFYDRIYQEFNAGNDCSPYLKQAFPMFEFSKDSVVDFLTAQYHFTLAPQALNNAQPSC